MERGGGKTGGGGKCEGEARGGKTQKRRSCLFLSYDEAFDEIEKKSCRFFFPSSDNFCNFVSFSLSSLRPLHPRPQLVRETSPAPIFCNQRWTVEKGL